MKKNELHNLIRQNIPQITYLETDSTEAAEGECTLWDCEDCTIMLDFADTKSDCHTVEATLQKVAEKLVYINQNKDMILNYIQTEQPNLSIENVRVIYVAFWIENARDVFCDFALSSEDWGDTSATFALEEDNELIFNGLENR